MRPFNAVLAHRNPQSVEPLMASLRKQFRNLLLAGSLDEARSAVARFRASFAVLDLELIRLAEVKELCSEFPATAFVCVHRLADDLMWSQALAAGAMDCCLTSDLKSILDASERYVALSRQAAA